MSAHKNDQPDPYPKTPKIKMKVKEYSGLAAQFIN